MKKMISFSLSVFFTLGVYAFPPTAKEDRIIQSFHRDFPNVRPEVVHNCGNSFIVYFNEDDHSPCRVFYDLNGVLLNVIKYYDASKLSTFLRSWINEKFHGAKITNMTEVVSPNIHFYEVDVQNTKLWYQVKCDASGSMEVEKKWHKS